MKITVSAEKPESGKLAAKVTVDAADVNAAIAKAYKDTANNYRFQGFRKGRAPRPVIDSMVGREYILAQATNEILNAVEPLMLNELDVVPVSQPKYSEGEEDPKLVEEGAEYLIEATIEVSPDCTLADYNNISIELPPATATDAEIDREIDQLLAYQVSYEDIAEDRELVKGDICSLDVEDIEDAGAIVGQNRMMMLDGQGMPDEFDDQLIGMKKGDVKEIEWTETHNHADHDHSVTRKAKVTLNAIKEKVIPELTDELANKGFGFNTVDELRHALTNEIEQDKARRLPTMKENRAVAALGELLEIDEVPENYQAQIFNEITQNLFQQLAMQGMTLDGYLQMQGISVDDFLADTREQARERSRQTLALDVLAKDLGLEATEDDVREQFANARPDDPEAAIEEFMGSGQMPAVREGIRRTKALEWLVEHVSVVEVDEAAKAKEAADEKTKEEKPKKTTKKKTTTKKSTSKKAAKADDAPADEAEVPEAEKKPKKATAKKSTTKKASTKAKAADASADDAAASAEEKPKKAPAKKKTTKKASTKKADEAAEGDEK